jgi:hypothetical protein
LFGKVGSTLFPSSPLPAQPIELDSRAVRSSFRGTQRPGEAIPLRSILGDLTPDTLDFRAKLP